MIKTVNRKTGLSEKLTGPSRAYQMISNVLVRSIPYIPSNERYNLTICHEKKFVWFRTAKVGTRTIFNVLRRARIMLDAEHAMDCRYAANLYEGYYKFAFVRNPWDRLVSCWINKVVDSNYYRFSSDRLMEMKSFNNFVNFVENENIAICDPHIRLQSKLIDLNNVDFIGRFERFEEDLSKVIGVIGIEPITIGSKNVSSNRSHYRDYYDDRLKDKVAEIYSRDINLFQYKF